MTQRHCHRLLASLMEQIDGCVLINRDGRVQKAKVWLTIKPEEVAAAPEVDQSTGAPQRAVGGSRQLSARRASAEIDGVVVTVSADGPVRAYHKGGWVLSTVGHEAAQLEDAAN